MDFASQLQTCQKILKQLLEEGKEEQSQPLSSPYQHPIPYDDLSHHYSDKFDQINSLTNQWIASTITCLENFGITNEILLQLIQLSFHTPIILRFQAIEKTQFLREIERKYDLKTNQIVYEDTHQNTFDRFFFKKYKIIKEYEWKFQLEYQVIILFNQHQPQSHHSPDSSNDHDHDNNQINLFNFTCQHIFTILKNEIFRPEMKILPDQDVDITWLLHQISPDNLLPTFEINRLHKKCYTPRRNPNIESVINFLEKFTSWSQQVVDYFRSEIFPLQIHYNPPHTPLPNMGSINTEGIFKPILPFYIGQSHELDGSDLAVISSSQELIRLNFHLPTYDELNQFKAHHTKTIYNKFIEINSIFPLPSSLTPPLLNAQTVNFLILLIHMNEISQLFSLSINSIENNLFKQFIKAIGKEIQPVDFRDYMIFHTRKLFLPEYQMKPFCYSIRKSPNHTPDGTISILDQTYPNDSSSSNHIYTFVDHQTPETSHLMSFPINAAVSVSFKGDRYLHGYLRHSFGTESLSTDNDNSSSKSHIFRLNSVGTVSSLSFDNAFGHGSKPKYYCGRFVGRYPSGCDSCDGYCGPSNGCQCDSCAQLVPDEDISSELLVRCPNGHLLQEVGYANNWVCDATGEGGCLIAGTQTNSRLFTKVLRYRCTGGCDFDYCYNCHQQKIQQNRQRLLQSCSPLVSCPLGHPLDLSNLKSPWYCDHSREIGGCPTTNSIRPSNGFEEFHHIVRWRCKEGCDFDYCDACYTQKYQQIYRPLPKASSSTPSIPPQILLTAQSRQYCTFILLLGRITSANTFDPKHAILLQNKDSINIPLELEIIPSLKEFNDLISSLSKKQQEFLQAYRSMQLESSLFGICLIPIKPLLEKVLNMPEDSLLKEIELTERILKLFLEYEIPSSILSYDGSSDASIEEKVNILQRNVDEVYSLINEIKNQELQDARQKALHNHYSRSPPGAFGGLSGRGSEGEGGGGVRGRGGGGGGRGRGRGPSGEKREYREMTKGSTSRGTTDTKNRSSGPSKPSSTDLSKPPTRQEAADLLPSTSTSLTSTNMNSPDSQTWNNPPPPTTTSSGTNMTSSPTTSNDIDYTKMPSIIEKIFDYYETNKTYSPPAIHPTIINISQKWKKETYSSILSPPIIDENYNNQQQLFHKNHVFLLLDCLTKSGSIPIVSCQFHIIITFTHCFTNSLLNSILIENINPIEEYEKSFLIMNSIISQEIARNILNEQEIERIQKKYSTMKFLLNERNEMKELPAAEYLRNSTSTSTSTSIR